MQLKFIILTYFVLPYMDMVAILAKLPKTNIIFILFHSMSTPYKISSSNSPVISEKISLDKFVAVRNEWPWMKVKGQLDLWYFYKTIVSLGFTFLASIMIST